MNCIVNASMTLQRFTQQRVNHFYTIILVRRLCARKGEYDLTADKSKAIMQQQKTNLRGIIGKYNASGNGSDMVQHPDDRGIGTEKSVFEGPGWLGADGDGDDRRNFLGMNSVDILYWWDVMDELNMIFIFMGKLHDMVCPLLVTGHLLPLHVVRMDEMT